MYYEPEYLAARGRSAMQEGSYEEHEESNSNVRDGSGVHFI